MGILNQTACKRGHEFTPENTRINSTSGGKVCVICDKMRSATYRAKKQTPKPSLEERFWSRVNKENEQGPTGTCWHWQGVLNHANYGVLNRGKLTVGKSKLAHRMAYEYANGEFDRRLSVRHKCDNPRCVNPSHLELGTHAENMADMALRGRSGHGNKTHCPKGHEYNEQNTVLYKGSRGCRICKSINSKNFVARRKAQSPHIV